MKEIQKSFTARIVAIWFRSSLFQQETVIRGRVIDKNERVSVIGANVIEYDKDNRVINGTVCDVNGDFVLEMKDPSNVVKVVMIGYNTKTITPGAQGNITIELEPEKSGGRSSSYCPEKRGKQSYQY